MNPLLDALGYVGESLDKPGAALRGLLAGQPGQLANLIPFSDTFGLTNLSERVSGRGLLEHYGLVNPKEEGEGFDLADALGIGTELALDPVNLLGGAGLRKIFKFNKLAEESNLLRAKNLLANKGTEELLRGGAMPEEIANLTKARTAEGPIATYHGTPHVFEQYDLSKMDPEGLYGPGIYKTIDPEIASEYSSKGAIDKKTFEIKPGAEEAIRNRLDLLSKKADATRGYYNKLLSLPEEEASKDWQYNIKLKALSDLNSERRKIQDLLRLRELGRDVTENTVGLTPSIRQHLNEVWTTSPRNVRKEFLDIRNPFDIEKQFTPEEAKKITLMAQGLDPSEVVPHSANWYQGGSENIPGENIYADIADYVGSKKSANEVLKSMGYDAIRHVGGKMRGGAPHQVYIAFDPKQVYKPLVAPRLKEVPEYLQEKSLSPLLAALSGYNLGSRLPEAIY